MGTATLVVVCHYLLHAKHFLLLRGQQPTALAYAGLTAETFLTPMGTATYTHLRPDQMGNETFLTSMWTATACHSRARSCCPETFHTPMGTATQISRSSLSVNGKHFIPLWGQQLGRCYRRHSNLRNISYPYGDSNTSA